MRKINLLDLVKKSLAAFTALAVGFGISAQAVSVQDLKSGLAVEVQTCANHGHDHDHDGEHHNHGHDHDDEHHNHDHDHDDDHHGH